MGEAVLSLLDGLPNLPELLVLPATVLFALFTEFCCCCRGCKSVRQPLRGLVKYHVESIFPERERKKNIYNRQLHLLPLLVRLPLLPLHSVGGSPSFSLPEEEPSLCSLPPSSWSSPGSGVVSLGARCGSGVIRRGGVFSPSRTKVSRLRGLPTWKK